MRHSPPSAKGIPFNAVSSDWIDHMDFYEGQLVSNGDTDDCVIFTAQESFDAQMDALLPNFPAEVQQEISAMGFMDLSSVDNKLHFHSSPRFAGVLTGNGTNGNNLPDPWNVFEKYGVVPFSVLPVLPSMTIQDYFAQIPANVMEIGAKFLALIGGAQSIKGQYVCNGTENVTAMITKIPQAPLCIAVAVDDGTWNQAEPGIASGTPVHSVMLYAIDASGDFLVYDHYQPAKKLLLPTYPILYAYQGVVSPKFAAPSAPVLPPNPTIAQEQTWLDSLKQWLTIILNSL
jgi:hypothetical protein